MTETQRLNPAQRDFFIRVDKAVLANPFSDERNAADLEIAGFLLHSRKGSPIDRAVAEVRNQVLSLEQAGVANLKLYSGQDREILRSAFLFDAFHRYLDQWDTLIDQQVTAGPRSLPAAFAADILDRFKQWGFSHEEACHYVALCYQIRRAYYFIDRGLVGRSPCMKTLREDLWNTVFTYDLNLYNQYLFSRMEDFSTLILGETGTGKGAAAMAIGRSGYIPYDEKKGLFKASFMGCFISLNLSQFPETLIESELFGHTKGSFTGAIDDHTGIFARCSPHGSIFLDEIGEVSVPVQIKLLKVLEERAFCPVGSHREEHFRGRIIAATNRISPWTDSKTFLREDFFYRLCSDIIAIPPLRQRIREDPGELDDLLAFTIGRIVGKPSPDLCDRVRATILEQVGMDYDWPGNVRELGQCARRVLLKRRYTGILPSGDDHAPSAVAASLARQMDQGNISVTHLTREYCRLLYETFGTLGAVSRRSGLDPRTVKKHVARN